jgi:hypothetical protein
MSTWMILRVGRSIRAVIAHLERRVNIPEARSIRGSRPSLQALADEPRFAGRLLSGEHAMSRVGAGRKREADLRLKFGPKSI